MYPLLQLIGVAAAIVAERWLRRPQPWQTWAIGALLLVALFDHISGVLLGVGLLAVAGVRRDRDAWHWRLVLSGVGLAWLVAWGPSMLDQLDGELGVVDPPHDTGEFAEAVSRQVTLASASPPS